MWYLSDFVGVNCESVSETCEHEPCLHGGTCIDTEDAGFDCVCVPGITGQYTYLQRQLRPQYCEVCQILRWKKKCHPPINKELLLQKWYCFVQYTKRHHMNLV